MIRYQNVLDNHVIRWKNVTIYHAFPTNNVKFRQLDTEIGLSGEKSHPDIHNQLKIG